jgi:hypothetical protein
METSGKGRRRPCDYGPAGGLSLLPDCSPPPGSARVVIATCVRGLTPAFPARSWARHRQTIARLEHIEEGRESGLVDTIARSWQSKTRREKGQPVGPLHVP